MMNQNRLFTVKLLKGCRFCSSEVSPVENVKRCLRVAILGSPNAGKSTLVNHLVGRTVCGVSLKVHTTRGRALAALVRGNTQIVFVDTPGLVSRSEMKRHHLEQSFENDSLHAINMSDTVGVVHDAGNPWTRDKLDQKVVRLLRLTPQKPHILILNKVDLMKNKTKILELVKILTNESIVYRNEQQIQRGWPNFMEVFMVSALKGDGTDRLTEYLLSQAREENWQLPEGAATDLPEHKLIIELVKARLLDNLPDEVPYNIHTVVEYFHRNDFGEVICVVLLTCPTSRYEKMLLKHGGKIVRKIAEAAEQDARNALQSSVRLRLVVSSTETKSNTRYER